MFDMARNGMRLSAKSSRPRNTGKRATGRGCGAKTGWRKEKKEHPWATDTQAKRIEKDHKKLGK
jgi:hypothetical protein